MDASLCPCGCGRPPRPGKMFAGPHLACLSRYRLARGGYSAHVRKHWEAFRVGKAAREHRALEALAGQPLSADEARVYRYARLRGAENGRKVAVSRHSNRARRWSVAVRKGSLGGQAAAKRKHQRGYVTALRIAGLAASPRTRTLYTSGYLDAYHRALAAATARLRRRQTTEAA